MLSIHQKSRLLILPFICILLLSSCHSDAVYQCDLDKSYHCDKNCKILLNTPCFRGVRKYEDPTKSSGFPCAVCCPDKK